MKLLPALVFACLLVACTATQDLANACQAAAAGLNTATALDKAGKLTVQQALDIDKAAALVNPLCGSATPPIDLGTAFSVVSQEVTVIQSIVGGK